MTFLGPFLLALIIGMFFLCASAVAIECGKYSRSEEAAERKSRFPKVQ